MPDPGSGLSRPCPSCGRRVPPSVAVCRCGAAVPGLIDESAGIPGPAAAFFSAGNLVIGLVLVAAIVATGYQSFNRPPDTMIGDQPGRGAASRGEFVLPPLSSRAPMEPADGRAAAGPRAGSESPTDRALAPQAAAAVPETALEDVVSRVMAAVVLVETSSGRGSGFYVRPDTVITNVHVVKDDGFVKLRRTDGTTVTARVDLRSPAHDLAILRVTNPAANQIVIPLGSANQLRAGQEVFTIGSPFGTLQNSVTRGVVSGIRRSGVATLVQNDAATHPGNSGGPLLDRSGVAIGVTTASDNNKPGINYAVAIDHARAMLDGRLADSSAPPLTLSNVKAAEPPRSESQKALDEGQRAFIDKAAALARAADSLDRDWKQFRASCYDGALPGSFAREWFVMLTPRALTRAQVPAEPCATFVGEVQQVANRMAADMRTALEQARRAGVLPGVVRDTLQSNRLEFDGWDR